MKDFGQLTSQILFTHDFLQKRGVTAVNIYLTLRNWLIGYYIVEYEQNGKDRAIYGANLLKNLADKINIKGLSQTNLKIARQFYFIYPQIRNILILNKLGLPEQIIKNINDISNDKKGQLSIDKLEELDLQPDIKSQLSTDFFKEKDISENESYIINKNINSWL